MRTRQRRLDEAIADTDSLYEHALALLEKIPDRQRGFRLAGISVSELVPHEARAGLFEDERRVRREKLESVTQSLRERFGDKGLTRGTLVRKNED